jgi:signal transduction histidine kinase
LSSLQLSPLLAAATTVPLLAAAGALTIADRGMVVDVPVPEPADWFVAVQASSAVVWLAASMLMMPRRDLSWSRLAALAGLSHALVAAGYAWAVHGLVGGHSAPGAAAAAAMVAILLPVEMPVNIFMIVSLPTGRLTRVGLDRLGWLAVSMATAGVLVEAVSDPDVVGTDFAAARNPLSLGLGPSPLTAALIAPAALLGTAVLVMKWRRSAGGDRLALRWIVGLEVLGTLIVIPFIAFASPGLSVGVAQVASAIGVLALAIVIRRQQLLGIERVLERTLQFVLLATLLATVYMAVILAGSELIGGGARPLAAAVVALAVLPLRDRVRGVVARFVYGDRANAADIVRAVAEQAASALAPCELVERFLADLVAGTGASGASVSLDGHGTIASVGEQTTDCQGALHLQLQHRGGVVGRLTLLPGKGESCLDPLAERVAVEVVAHIAIVADACRSDIELQQARSRLVQGREEERRRLRHDLHDGLGPILTGAAFSADAASNLVRSDPSGASELIAAARRDVTMALDEIRRIVDDLRPPALDELGLVGAIRQHAQRLPQLDVTVSSGAHDSRLPAAVEVAAYRIATEALTNVARHSDAVRVSVDVTLNGRLAVTIADDGRGSAPWSPGVGLTSMRDRATELGGELVAGPGSDGGGLVVASLPVHAP